jgi:hypothetical protein
MPELYKCKTLALVRFGPRIGAVNAKLTMKPSRFLVPIFCLLWSPPFLAASRADEAALPATAEAFWASWESAQDWSVGDVLFPNLHLHGVGGWVDGHLDEVETGSHDPSRGTFSAQALEPGLSLRTKHVEGFANAIFWQDSEGDWDGDLEEAFLKLTGLPGDWEFKGGRFLSRFGVHNATHLHGWDFVDAAPAPVTFLGEHGLMLEGGEATWRLPLRREPYWTAEISAGFGNAPSHDHGGHDHEEHDDGEEVPHEGHEAAPVDDVATARAVVRRRFDDFHSVISGLSWANGTNGFGRSTDVFGIDLSYEWRERGLEPGGRSLRWTNELLQRRVDAFSEHDDDDDGVIDESFRGSYDETGFHTDLTYGWNEHVETSLRLAWLEGVDDFGQSGRMRVSPAVTCWLDARRRVGLRLQYNHDDLDNGEEIHALWFQVNIALGSTEEVR